MVVLRSSANILYLGLVAVCLIALPGSAPARDDAAGIWLVGRLRAKYSRPLGADGRRSLVLSAESFFDLGSSDRGGDAGISQGRLITGLVWKTGRSTRLEIDYMYQHGFVERAPDRANHIAILRYSIDLR